MGSSSSRTERWWWTAHRAEVQYLRYICLPSELKTTADPLAQSPTTMRPFAFFLAVASAATLGPLGAQEPAGKGTVVLRAARVIDGTGSAPVANGVVVVTDDRIVA